MVEDAIPVPVRRSTMSEDISLVLPARPRIEVVLTPTVEVLPPAASVTRLTPEQVHAREAVFTQQAQERESQQVMGLLTLWSGTLLLHDLAVETFSESEEEEEPRREDFLPEDEPV
jgi:hypothetical protein